MKPRTEQPLQRWLDEAASAMGGRASRRRDALLELEATIYERLEERTGGEEPTEDAVRDVLEAMGDATEVGVAFAPMPALVEARHTRPFVLHTFLVFALHFLLVIGATMAAQPFALPPFTILPVANPRNFLDLFARIVETLVFDAGLVLCGYLLLARLGLLLRVPRAALAVLPDRRRCVESAIFLFLVMVVVNFFRDSLLAVYLRNGPETTQLPLVGPGILDNLLLFNSWLLASIARDVGYFLWGERRGTLAGDLVASAAGVFCLLRMVAAERLIDLSPVNDNIGPAADHLGALLNAAFMVLMLLGAAALSARLVRRLFRLALLRK